MKESGVPLVTNVGRPRPVLLIDAHVHYHPCYDPTVFLNGALANFRTAAHGLGAPVFHGVLLLTEGAGRHAFEQFRCGDLAPEDGWAVHPTGEANSILAIRDGDTVAIVAGRQVATTERLEVLALGLLDDLPDGMPLATTIHRILERRSIPVLPWGFGKWWFRRGRLVAEVIAAADRTLFVGDNGGRPGFVPRSRLLDVAAARGIWNLPGSDPLAFPDRAGMAGRCGCVLRCSWEADRLGGSVLDALRALRTQPTLFGHPEAPARFLRAQLALRLRKAVGSGP